MRHNYTKFEGFASINCSREVKNARIGNSINMRRSNELRPRRYPQIHACEMKNWSKQKVCSYRVKLTLTITINKCIKVKGR